MIRAKRLTVGQMLAIFEKSNFSATGFSKEIGMTGSYISQLKNRGQKSAIVGHKPNAGVVASFPSFASEYLSPSDIESARSSLSMYAKAKGEVLVKGVSYLEKMKKNLLGEVFYQEDKDIKEFNITLTDELLEKISKLK